MTVSFRAQSAAYREAAAARFANRGRDMSHNQSERHLEQCAPADAAANTPVGQYKRRQFPALQQYLRDAAAAFARAKQRANRPHRPRPAAALGHGEPVAFLFAALRRQRWRVARAEEAHRVRALRESVRVDAIAACGIPKDVREGAAAKFMRARERRRQLARHAAPYGLVLGERRTGDIGLQPPAIIVHPEFAEHVKRCDDAHERGETGLQSLSATPLSSSSDTFEEVRRRYSGKPDELYRRKTARRFATWRRKHREKEQHLVHRLDDAEREMKKRRGHDQLLTARHAGDSSFAPFLFDLDSNAYAFSSKISEAPKLRRVMLEKYTSKSDESSDLNLLEKAHQAAETNPLFHTRVMNRFS